MISIVIPCYNDNAILSRAVNSALNQRYDGDYEIIIVDDGSDTPINGYSADKIRIIRHKTNRGLSAALNTGIRRSRGDRFAILASDDQFHPTYLARVSSGVADVVSCDLLVNGKHVAAKAPESLEELMEHNCHSYAALYSKKLWQAVGGYKETMNPSWEDWEFALSVAKAGATWSHVSEPLHIYHRNPTGRDAQAQGKESLLWGKLMGYHQDLYGIGRGVVSFVVPCYKHEEFVAYAVQTALDQEYPHVNVVVVDDGSPGDVPKALENTNDNRVTLIRQDNRHLSGARNTGIMYALQEYGSEYLVMLDADDGVLPSYVEATMGELKGREYVYTDVTFIGDAYHQVAMEPYDCMKLLKKHLHPCTFLMPSQVWQDVVAVRGYGYDEGMKQGYEDWEFALAAVEVGWCGHRLPGHLFQYRYHKDGSMRTQASKINSKLVRYIRSKHPWITNKELAMAGCSTCGGRGRFTSAAVRGGVGTVLVPGIGEVNPEEILEILYTGAQTSTITKVGAGGQIYKYSGDPAKQARGYGPQFTIKAIDAHLFVGPYKMRRIGSPSQQHKPQVPTAVAQRRVEVVPLQQRPAPPPAALQQPQPVQVVHKRPAKLDEMPVEEALEITSAGKEFAPEDFTQLTNVGGAGHKKLVAAGFTIYDDVAEASPTELAMVLGISEKRAEKVQESAQKIIEEYELEDE